jgi:hypothetical protein
MAEAYTALYCDGLKDLCASLDPKDLVLFIFLCAHGNENGICYPSVKTIGQQLDWRFEEVRYRLDRLEHQGLISYLRRAARNAYTGEFVNDLYQMNPKVYKVKNPVTHPSENAEPVPVTHPSENAEPDGLRMPPSNLQHNQLHNQRQQLTPLTNSSNQHQQPDKFPLDGGNTVTGEPSSAPSSAFNPENAKPDANTQTQDSGQSAPAGTKPTPVGHAESNTPPGSASPPIQPMIRYVNALPDVHLEALANEVKAMAPTRLYNARELVMRYGEANVRKGLVQLEAAKTKGSVYNPMGLLTTWLRTGALKAEPEHENEGLKYITGKYAHIIEH